jgi:hypothetical protein
MLDVSFWICISLRPDILDIKYCQCRIQPLVTFLSHLHIWPHCLRKIHFNIILPSPNISNRTLQYFLLSASHTLSVVAFCCHEACWYGTPSDVDAVTEVQTAAVCVDILMAADWKLWKWAGLQVSCTPYRYSWNQQSVSKVNHVMGTSPWSPV